MLPLLLPDSPVAIWWPTAPPADPATDPLGALAQRRITDSAAVTRGKSTAMLRPVPGLRPRQHRPELDPAHAVAGAAGRRPGPAPAQGDRRLGHGRADQPQRRPARGVAGRPAQGRGRPARSSDGPGITEVTMDTKEGPIRISRADGRLATFTSPNRPDRPVALKRREVPALLAEELRRLDEDDVYAATARTGWSRCRAAKSMSARPSGAHRRPVVARGRLHAGRRRRLARCSTASRRRRPAARCPRSGSPAAPSPTSSTARSPAAPPDSAVDWSRVVIWWGDERFVPADVRRPQRAPGPRGVPRPRPPSTRPTSTRCRRATQVATVEEAAAAYGETHARARRRVLRGADARRRPRRPRRLAVPRPPGAGGHATRSPSPSTTPRSRRPSASASPSRRWSAPSAVWFLVSGAEQGRGGRRRAACPPNAGGDRARSPPAASRD